MAAIENRPLRTFAARDGGRCYDGVFAKDASYWNPFADALAGGNDCGSATPWRNPRARREP